MPSLLAIFRNYLPTWNEVRNKPTGFDPDAHKASHEKSGSDEISVTALSGALADEQNAGAIKSVLVNDAAKADTYLLSYDSGSNRIIYVEPPAG